MFSKSTAGTEKDLLVKDILMSLCLLKRIIVFEMLLLYLQPSPLHTPAHGTFQERQ